MRAGGGKDEDDGDAGFTRENATGIGKQNARRRVIIKHGDACLSVRINNGRIRVKKNALARANRTPTLNTTALAHSRMRQRITQRMLYCLVIRLQ